MITTAHLIASNKAAIANNTLGFLDPEHDGECLYYYPSGNNCGIGCALSPTDEVVEGAPVVEQEALEFEDPQLATVLQFFHDEVVQREYGRAYPQRVRNAARNDPPSYLARWLKAHANEPITRRTYLSFLAYVDAH